MRNLLAAVLILRGLTAFALGVQPEIPVSSIEFVPARFTSGERLATNGQIYVAAWTDLRSLPSAAYAARFRPDGTLLDRVGIRVADSSVAGEVIWTGNAFLLSYLQGGVEGGTIHVRTLTPDGILGEPVALFTTETPATQFRMRLATNGDSVLLVTSDSNGALLDPDGQKRRDIDFDWEFGGRFSLAAAGPAYLVAAPRFNRELKTQIVTAGGDLGETEILMDTVGGGGEVASDGDRFLVVWARGNLYAQFLTGEGVKIEPLIKLTDVPNVNERPYSVGRLVRRGDEYVLVYSDRDGFATLRLGNAGDPRGPLLTNVTAGLNDIAVSQTGGAALTGSQEALTVAFFDGGAPTPLRNPTPLSLTGKRQQTLRLAHVEGGFVAAWREEFYMPELYLSRGHGSTPVLVVADYARVVDVVVESNVVWVVWVTSEKREVYTRRFTQALEPIDAEPVLVTSEGAGVDHAVAAGGGAVVVVRNQPQGSYGSEPGGAHIDAHILRGTASGVTVTSVGITTISGYDHAPAVEWNGSDFTIAWANATEGAVWLRPIAVHDVYTGIFPDDRIVAVHMSAAGEVRESQPLEIALTKHVDDLRVVNGIAVWQTYGAPSISQHRHTYAARVAAGAAVADLGGEDAFFGAVAPDGGGFILTRARPLSETTIAPEILTVDANLSVTATAALAPIVTDFFYDDVNPYDADILGGPARMIGYTRIAPGAYGHAQRAFVRRITETARRRALRVIR